ncbi:MAG: hypothetical protein HWD60_15450 [Defluviicoccus sp.]|nr:MAG: hypothetical protein HWD60_15450 [Defluviicoccus sp.]
MEKIMRLTPAISAAIVALFGGTLVAANANAADTSREAGFLLVAEGGSTMNDNVQGTAPHTGTGLGEKQPPAADLPERQMPPAADLPERQMPPSPVTNPAAPDDVQGTAPHTGTGLGQKTAPPPQTMGRPNYPNADESPSGTSEGNVSKPEKKMGEKPSP